MDTLKHDNLFLFALASVVFLSFFLLPHNAGAVTSPTVKVKAQIEATQIIEIEGQNYGGSRKQAVTPIGFKQGEGNSDQELTRSGVLQVNIGSNKDWQLLAKVRNLEESIEAANESGWKLEEFSITTIQRKIEASESEIEVASGSIGRMELEVSYQISLSAPDSAERGDFPLDKFDPLLVLIIN